MPASTSSLAERTVKNFDERPVNQPSQYGAVLRRGVRQTNSNGPVGESDFVINDGTEVRAESVLRIVCEVILGKECQRRSGVALLMHTGT